MNLIDFNTHIVGAVILLSAVSQIPRGTSLSCPSSGVRVCVCEQEPADDVSSGDVHGAGLAQLLSGEMVARMVRRLLGCSGVPSFPLC